ISSAAAVGLYSGTSWLNEGIFLQIIDELGFSLPYSVGLIDPLQPLVPPFTNFLTLVAAPAAHHWAPVFQTAKSRTRLPHWIGTDFIRELLEMLTIAWREHAGDEAQVIEAVSNKLSLRFPHAEMDVNFSNAPLREYEGLHPMFTGGGWWLGAFNGDDPF